MDRKKGAIACPFYAFLFEVSLQQTLQSLAVASFVASHLVDGVVDGVEVESLGFLGQLGLAGGGAVFGGNAHFEVLLGAVGHNFTEKLGKLGGVLRFFVSGFFPVKGDFRVTLSGGDARHGEVHTDFGAFTVEVGAEAFFDFFRHILGDADNMLGSPGELFVLQFNKLFGRGFADGAGDRGGFAFDDFTADQAFPLSLSISPLL